MPTIIEKNTINIRFTNENIKAEMHRITIHTPTDADMKEFLEILQKVLLSFQLNIKSLGTIHSVIYNYLKEAHNDYLETCDWSEMPEFLVDEELRKTPSVILYIEVCDKEKELCDALAKATGKTFTTKSTYVWFPSRPVPQSRNNYYITDEKITPKYPIFIISKGRWDTRQTSKYLEWANIDYKIVVESSEYEQYAKVINPSKILIMPDEFKAEQVALGNGGGIPVRNFVMRYSKANGDKRHWILDDNIVSYKRLNNSDRTICKTGAVFRSLEDYVDRYTNILLAGHNYSMFGVSTNTGFRPIIKNTRIYSSILIHNDIPFEWRGKYNEDTDLSLRVMKAGFPTILFNHILADKLKTLTTKGGNTDTIYAVENFGFLKSNSLKEQHPDCAIVKERYGRTHHLVNYEPFKALKAELIPEYTLNGVANNYGMKLGDKKANVFFK